MKVRLDRSNWNLIYSIEKDPDTGIECKVPEKRLANWRRIEAEFYKMQDEMEAAYEKAQGD